MPWETFDANGTPVMSGGGTSGVPCVRALRSAAQSVNDSSNAYIALNDADAFDTDTMHDPSSNNTRITFHTAGVYQLTGEVTFGASVVGVRYVFFDLNGGATRVGTSGGIPPSTAAMLIQVSALYKFAVNDYVELGVFQNSTGALDITDSKAMAVRVAAG